MVTATEEVRKELTVRDLLDAGLHFGHQTKRWNPKMKKYIFDKRNGIHIIDLTQSLAMLKKALEFIRSMVLSGRCILLVGTKKQAQEIVKECATSSGQFYVTQRWLGGTLTNNATIRRSIEHMRRLEAQEKTDNFGSLHKQEASRARRELEKLRRNLSGVAGMGELPGAMFVVDITREAIAVAEANKLGIPVVAIVDTNCDPDPVDYLIPGNDDSLRAVKLIATAVSHTVKQAAAEYAKVAAELAKKKEADKAEKAAAIEAARKEREKVREQEKEAKAQAPKKPVVDRKTSALSGTKAAALVPEDDAGPEDVVVPEKPLATPPKAERDLRRPLKKRPEHDTKKPAGK